MSNYTNRLAAEKSPYLLQHAGNPVDWYPWGDEAFEKARREEKPVFLSIGYATCHWCHVMERESFEDKEVAELLNASFVAVKVDREERPDIDGVYMTVCQILTGQGGWPLTLIMTPDRRPFFAATYIPKHGAANRMGMMDLLPRIADLWKINRAVLTESGNKVAEALQNYSAMPQSGPVSRKQLDEAYRALARVYDRDNGGFGTEPKFPTAHNLMFLLRYWKRTGNKDALAMVEHTLTAMRRGGVYDHIGFGIHRYSTDRCWLVPHFEKMLYDQALTAIAYAEAYQASGNLLFKNTGGEILSYILRQMTSPEYAFYSAEDADSEGEEGKFYVWRRQEVLDILGAEEGELFCGVMHIREDGNYAEEHGGAMTGTNIPHLRQSIEEYAALIDMPVMMLKARFDMARTRLFNERQKRGRPFLDDKVLTDWNGLALAALAKGAQAFGDDSFAREAVKAAGFLLSTMRKEDGTLWHRYRQGETAVPGNLDDYAFLTWGLIELYETVFDPRYLSAALELSDTMLRLFDAGDGALYFTPADGEPLLARRKEIYDGAIPSGNAVAALNLLRLGRMTGNEAYARRGEELLNAFAGAYEKNPDAYCFGLAALDFALGPSTETVIVSPYDAAYAGSFIKRLRAPFLPNMVVLFAGADAREVLSRVAPFTAGMEAAGDEVAAYVCRNFTCSLPVSREDAMMEQLMK